MGELGRVGAQLRHDDAEVGVQPLTADGVLHEAALVGERPEVLADVDHTVGGRVEPEVGGDRLATERLP